MSKNVFWVVARLPPRLKSMFFEIFSNGATPKGEEKIQKTLILVFEVIVQPLKTHFSAFSKVQKQKKSETKIMKITNSYLVINCNYNFVRH